MSAEAKTGTVDALKGILLRIENAILLAEDYLAKSSDATLGCDPKIVEQIKGERKIFDTFLAQLTEARSITDHDLLIKAIGGIKLHDPTLRAVSERVKGVASETATPLGVSGYMEQVVTLIAEVHIFMTELP